MSHTECASLTTNLCLISILPNLRLPATLCDITQLSEVRESHKEVEADFAKVVEERDQLYDSFEGAVRAIQQKSDFRWVGYNAESISP